MATEKPTLQELRERCLAMYAMQLEVPVETLGTYYVVEANVLANMLWPLYLYGEKTERNIYADISDTESLTRRGLVKLGRPPKPAVQGRYEAIATGIQPGATLQKDAIFVASAGSSSSGALFVAEYTYSTSPEEGDELWQPPQSSILIRGLDAGLRSFLKTGETLKALQPQAGMNDIITISAVKVPAAAAEEIESYRSDVIEAERNNAQLYNAAQIRIYCNAIAEIRAVYVYMKEGVPGTLEVFVEATKENTEPGNIIGQPQQATIDAVYKLESGIETGVLVYDESTGDPRRAITVNSIEPKAAVPVAVQVNIVGLEGNYTASLIKTTLEDEFYKIRPFLSGAESLSSKRDTLTYSVLFNGISRAIENTGSSFVNISMEIDGQLKTSETFHYGRYPYLAVLTNNGVPI